MSDEFRSQKLLGNEADHEHDPLAELARIVAGELESDDTKSINNDNFSFSPAPAIADATQEMIDADTLQDRQSNYHTAIAEGREDGEDHIFQERQDSESELSPEVAGNDLAGTAPLSETTVEQPPVFEPPHMETSIPMQLCDGDIPGDNHDDYSAIEFENELINVLKIEADTLSEAVEASIPNEQDVISAIEKATADLQIQLDEIMPAEASPSPAEEIPNQSDLATPVEVAQPVADIVASINHEQFADEYPISPVAPNSSHLLKEDLGVMFANEFEQIMANEPAGFDLEHPQESQLHSELTETPADEYNVAAIDAGVGDIDFSEAFAQELGIENIVETHDREKSDAQSAANAASEQALHAGYHPDAVNGAEDQNHTAWLADSATITGKHEIPKNATDPQTVENTGGGRKYAIAAMIIALIMGSILAGYSFLGRDGIGTVQIVKADSTVFKVKPESPGGRIASNVDMASYERVEGQNIATVQQETLISGTEEPAEIAEPRRIEVNNVVDKLPRKADQRLAETKATAVELAPIGNLLPRVVHIVSVKPDGTMIGKPVVQPVQIKSAEETQKQKLVETASEKKTAIKIETAAVTSNTTNANTAAVTSSTADTTNTNASTAAVAIKTIDTVIGNAVPPEPAITVTGNAAPPEPAITVTGNVSEPDEGATQLANIPIPKTRPLRRPEPVSEQEFSTDTDGSEWVVQVSSQRSPEAAQTSYNSLRNRFSVLQDREMSIQRANINGSVFFRVQVETTSRSDAYRLCESLKSLGGSCFVPR